MTSQSTGKLLVANFKMNLTQAELRAYFAHFPAAPQNYPHTIVFCPTFTGLDCARQLLTPPYYLGAQNVHYAANGAFTGEVSAPMLQELGVQYVIIGHRERRFYNREANHILNLKIKAALQHQIKVILCVGEDAAQYHAGKTEAVLRQQIKTTLQDIPDTTNVYLAYEPTWAIGGDSAASLKEIRRTVNLIQQMHSCPVLYGGSVNAKNAAAILKLPEIAGILVGRAALDPQAFATICEVHA